MLIQKELAGSGQSYLAVSSGQIASQEVGKSELILRIGKEEARSMVVRDSKPEPEAVPSHQRVVWRELRDHDVCLEWLVGSIEARPVQSSVVEGLLFQKIQVESTHVVDLAPNVELNDAGELLVNEGDGDAFLDPTLVEIEELGLAFDGDRHRILA